LTPNNVVTDLSGLVAVVTGAAAGLGRAEAIGLARAGATVVVNDIAGALDKSDVIDAITTAGSKAVAVAGDIGQRSTADELVETADGLGGLSIVRQQRRDHPRPHVVQNVRRRLGCSHVGAPARPLPADPQRCHLLAGEGEGRGGNGLRAHHQHLFGSRPGRAAGAGQLRRGQSGITALTLSAARVLERYGVRANAIAPRARTAMTADVFGESP